MVHAIRPSAMTLMLALIGAFALAAPASASDLASSLAPTAGPASAASILQTQANRIERVRESRVIRCGAVIRPGLAFPGPDHAWHGLEVDLCRSIADAVAGGETKVAFTGYATEREFARAGREDDIAFLTGSEIFAHKLFAAVLPGPAVFYEPTQIMVFEDNRARHVADLRDTMICAEPGTGAERNLQAYMTAHAIPFHFSGWQEVEEEMDAFEVGRCPAVAGEATALAALRFGLGEGAHHTRLLPEPLALVPVLATTPATDTAWFATVSWAIETVLATTESSTVQGPRLPIDTPSPAALAPDWQARLLKGGGYQAMFDAELGADSPLDLKAGANAAWSAGGLLAPPIVE